MWWFGHPRSIPSRPRSGSGHPPPEASCPRARPRPGRGCPRVVHMVQNRTGVRFDATWRSYVPRAGCWRVSRSARAAYSAKTLDWATVGATRGLWGPLRGLESRDDGFAREASSVGWGLIGDVAAPRRGATPTTAPRRCVLAESGAMFGHASVGRTRRYVAAKRRPIP